MKTQQQLTDEQIAEWQRRFEEANTPAARAAHMRREMRRLLSRRVRFRIWRHRRVDKAAFWLLDHHRRRTAVALWRVTRLWGG